MTDKEKLLAEIDKCLKETSRSKELVTAFIENVEEDKVGIVMETKTRSFTNFKCSKELLDGTKGRWLYMYSQTTTQHMSKTLKESTL